MNQSEANQLQEPQKSWWQRNWKWFVPTGCFTLLALVSVFVVIVYFSVASAMKQAEPFIDGFKNAMTNSYVIESLGEPIELGEVTEEDIVIGKEAESVDIYFSVKGSKSEGTVHVVGKKLNGEWQYSEMSIYIEATEETIDLLEE
ncbi:hypothetical protein IMCC3317_32900 [Kordia antarctica]|uniref:Cytochrome oxidase complex assembly protein 1 n=1 Tax=Kordia antarctica TaxID=1218801 RepID=A0A7L4ZN47_9FLAO|nr:cytochrome c oxidase assembly factor Coa1 family protein [Kordia antarctica]QHI37907.1 hypothetical protein IMCC3317_32900 [Kordia antarctica]